MRAPVLSAAYSRLGSNSILSRATLIALPFIVAISSVSLADDGLVRSLLTEGWDNEPEAKSNAEELLSGARRAEPNATTSFAAGLVKINHKKYSDALEWMSLALIADESHLQARRANIWLLARTKQYTRSLDQLSIFVDQIKAAEALEDEQRDDLIRFAGRMLGFFVGPANESISPATIDRVSRDVIAKLDDRELEIFEEAQDGVLKHYDAYLAEKTEEDETAIAEAEVEQARVIEELEKRLLDMTAEVERILPELNAIRDEARRELDSIRGKDSPLASEQAGLETRAASLNNELALIISDINRLEFRAAREQDRFYRDSYLREADDLRFDARRIEADLIAAQREINVVASKRRVLQTEFNRTEAIYGRQIEGLTKQLDNIRKSMQRADRELNRARGGPDTDLRRSRSLNATLKAVTTYEEFPLEEERRRVLAEL